MNEPADRTPRSTAGRGRVSGLQIRGSLEQHYPDVITPQVKAALHELAPFDHDRKAVMQAQVDRRTRRARNRERIAFLDPDGLVPRTRITVRDARRGAFVGSEIPEDLKRQWIQGTGP